ncbi:MAG: hypothetical protein ACTSRG_23510 [Candidatus Helarchaeota archaeon]
MIKKINFKTLLKELEDDQEIKEIIDNDKEILNKFERSFLLIKSNPDITQQKFYIEMKKILEIERKMDLE